MYSTDALLLKLVISPPLDSLDKEVSHTNTMEILTALVLKSMENMVMMKLLSQYARVDLSRICQLAPEQATTAKLSALTVN
jgi:hypothetical protein